MYPDSGYKLAHAQSVCTRPFSPHWEGPGDEARMDQDILEVQGHLRPGTVMIVS